MNPTYNTQSAARKWLPILVLALLLLAVVRICYAIYLRTSTGTLHITTKEPNAIVSISQANKQATSLGKGDVTARLKPGDYLVTATLAGDLAKTTVHIAAGQTTNKRVNPVHTTPPPTGAALTSFLNFDVLINYGLDSDQALRLKELVSDFAPTAQIISVDPTSVTTPPRDGNTLTMQFGFTVDGTAYNARVQYVILGDIILTVTDTTGKQIYSSEPAETLAD
jgi:hypothetical protein